MSTDKCSDCVFINSMCTDFESRILESKSQDLQNIFLIDVGFVTYIAIISLESRVSHQLKSVCIFCVMTHNGPTKYLYSEQSSDE